MIVTLVVYQPGREHCQVRPLVSSHLGFVRRSKLSSEWHWQVTGPIGCLSLWVCRCDFVTEYEHLANSVDHPIDPQIIGCGTTPGWTTCEKMADKWSRLNIWILIDSVDSTMWCSSNDSPKPVPNPNLSHYENPEFLKHWWWIRRSRPNLTHVMYDIVYKVSLEPVFF